MKVCFEDIGHMSATFLLQSGQGGEPVKVCGNGTVCGCADGDIFCGVMENHRGGYAGVQLRGFVTLPYSGSAPALGYAALAADGNGGVKVASGGRNCLVVSVDSDVNCVTFEL